MNDQKREIGIDVLKILCMFLVIAFHYSDHGEIKLIADTPLTFNWLTLASARIWGGICNSVFMLTTGYFLSGKHGFNCSKLIKLYSQVLFYSIISGAIVLLFGYEQFSVSKIVKMVFPFTFNRYWYFSTYILIYLIHPFLNKMIETLKEKQLAVLCGLLLILFSIIPTIISNSWLHDNNNILIFIALYFVGAYIKRKNISWKKRNLLVLSIVVMALEVLSLVILKKIALKTGDDSKITMMVWETEKIFPVLLGILLFVLFSKIMIRSNSITKVVQILSPSLFGIYLFHIGDLSVILFGKVFNNEAAYGSNLFILHMIAAMCSIFVIGIIVETVRKYLVEKLMMSLFARRIELWQEKIDIFFNP